MNTETDNKETEEEFFCCDTKTPKKVYFKHTTQFVALCHKCGFVCAYWECACELKHDCAEY